jgi:hypothetical protein
MDYASRADSLNRAMVEFIKIDLDLATTFVELAQESENKETIARNQRNARNVYDAVAYCLSAASLSKAERENITVGLSDLDRGANTLVGRNYVAVLGANLR